LETRCLPAQLNYTAPFGNGPDDLVLRHADGLLQLWDNGVLVASPALADTASVVITGANGEDDQLTIDYAVGGFFSISDGITFTNVDGVAGTDRLSIVGDGVVSGSYLPSATVPGSGTVTVGGTAVTLAGVEQVAVSGLTGFTLTTPGSADVLTVDSPAAGQNRVSGTSDGASFVPLTFSAVTSFTLDAAANDAAGSGSDSVLVSSGGSAAGLMTFSLNTGAGEDAVTVDRPFVLPVAGGSLQVDVGTGTDMLTVTGTSAGDTIALTDSTVTINGNLVTFSNLETLTVNTLDGADTVTMTSISSTTVTTVDVGLEADVDRFAGTVAGDFPGNLTLLHFEEVRLHVGGDFSGRWMVTGSGTIDDLALDGSLTATATVQAEDITNIQVMGNLAGTVTAFSLIPGVGSIGTMTVGGNFTGTISATGSLGTLTVGGLSTGTITAGDVGLIMAPSSSAGSPVLQVTEAGVTRRLLATRADNGLPAPSTVRFAYVYDSIGPGDPQFAVRVTNGSPSTATDDVRFDLGLDSTPAAKTNLALVYASGTSGLRNVTVRGDLLTSVSPAALAFLGLPAGTLGGVRLPLDLLAAVAIQGNLVAGSVQAASVQAVAFGSITTASGTISAPSANHVHAASALAAGTATVTANDTYRVPFREGQRVALFLDTGPGTFDSKSVLFTDQTTDNAAVTAVVTATGGVLSTVQLLGDGGAIETAQRIGTSISSTGPLGDLFLSSSYGLRDVTAPSIFGNIDTKGPIFGTIQTTVGDLGRAITNGGGTIIGTTIVTTNQGITGRIISRGNVISRIDTQKEFSGVVAAQGDLGVAYVNGMGQLVRFGGLISRGQFTGRVVVLGNLLGDVDARSGLSGRIAVKGRTIAGLAASRIGILGNFSVQGSIQEGSAIVSGGLIGDAAGGTFLTAGSVKGILAAKGGINFGQTGSRQQAAIYENATGVNAAAIDAIFTRMGGVPHGFDLVGMDLAGLALMLTDLAALRVGPGGNLTGPIA
jgi:hypothetical protein